MINKIGFVLVKPQLPENIGFGLGTLVGGVLAGPIGVIVGASGGTWLGARESETDETIAALEKELNAKSIEIAY